MVQFENSFTNFVQSNNYYENSTINEQSFETLVNKMNLFVDECFLLDKNMQRSKHQLAEKIFSMITGLKLLKN